MKYCFIVLLLVQTAKAQLPFFANTANSTGVPLKAPTGTKVIILAGQSNAEGYTNAGSSLTPTLRKALAGVYRKDRYTNPGSFVILNDSAVSNNVGLDNNLCYLYQQYHAENIYIIKFALGSTVLRSNITGTNGTWNAGVSGGLYDSLVSFVNAGMAALTSMGLNPTIRSFVWYQGESDGDLSETQSAYQVNEQNFFSSLRTAISAPALKIYSVLVQNRNTGSVLIRAAKTANVSAITNYALINVDDLETNDGTHLTETSQIELGRRLFNLIKGN